MCFLVRSRIEGKEQISRVPPHSEHPRQAERLLQLVNLRGRVLVTQSPRFTESRSRRCARSVWPAAEACGLKAPVSVLGPSPRPRTALVPRRPTAVSSWPPTACHRLRLLPLSAMLISNYRIVLSLGGRCSRLGLV